MRRLTLGTGLLRRGSTLLVVQSLYAAGRLALWTLPGGRQEDGETIPATVLREFKEETSLTVILGNLAFLSESIDRPRDLHVVNCTFWVSETDPTVLPHSSDPKVAAVRFAPFARAIELLRADVLRVPVKAALEEEQRVRYFSFDSDTTSVPFFPSPG